MDNGGNLRPVSSLTRSCQTWVHVFGLFCRKLPAKFGDLLSEDQLKEIEELGLLADLDDQVRTQPLHKTSKISLQAIMTAAFPVGNLELTVGLCCTQPPTVLLYLQCKAWWSQYSVMTVLGDIGCKSCVHSHLRETVYDLVAEIWFQQL